MQEASMVIAEKENVLIQAGDCAVAILPHLGGKIASIRIKGRELLQSPLAAYGPRTQTMDFDESDASGWDECLPSVAACVVETAGGPVSIPDHGDVWRVAWEEDREKGTGNRDQASKDAGDGRVTLHGVCFSLPLTLKRSVSLQKTRAGWQLKLNYLLTNVGEYPVPWSWAAHPLFAVEAGDRIVLPSPIRTLRLEGSGGDRLGMRDAKVSWPIAALADGDHTELSVALSPESGVGDKLFAGPLSESEGWCALERPKAGVRIKVRFDPAATPYLGLWICYGGWPDRPGAKQNCVALEPSTAPVDSLAQPGPWSRVLAPGDCFSWPMNVEFESMEKVV